MLIPRFPCPDGMQEPEYLRTLVRAGLRERYGDPPPAEAIERMEMELGVIERMGYCGYFLIVWDFINHAKSNGIAVGPGRGSAAGSLVAYCLRITDLDPLRYDLLFERFLNPERVSMPDIDIDFSVRGRERVMRYVIEKYGADRVAQIITFGKMFPRAATRDAARVLGYDYAKGDALAKLIPDPIMGRAPSFERVPGAGRRPRGRGGAGPGRQADRRRRPGPRGHRPQRLDPRGRGRHRRPPADGHRAAAARRRRHGRARQQGLPHGHAVLDEAHRGARPAQDGLPRPAQPRRDRGRAGHHRAAPPASGRTWRGCRSTTRETYEMLARGDSIGVFQFESEGMREALKRVEPTEFDDLVALVALYRPGAMDQIPHLRARQEEPGVGRRSWTSGCARSRSPTKGVILYQEQSMQIAKTLAGFSGAKADDLRKAIGKKNREAMAKLKPEFFEGCRRQRRGGVGDRVAVGDQREGRRLLLQQVPRRLLRADLLPDGVAAGQLPRRVHGRADLVGDGHQGQGPVLRRPGGADGDRDPAAGRQRVRPRVHGRRRQHPLRAGRGEGRRLRRGGGDQEGPRRGDGGPFTSRVGLLRARRRPRRSTSARSRR